VSQGTDVELGLGARVNAEAFLPSGASRSTRMKSSCSFTPGWVLWAKFHYPSWFEAGSKLVADRFEAGRRPVSNLSATSFEPASNQIA